MTDSPPSLDPPTVDFIERMGAHACSNGGSRISGRIMALLLVSSRPLSLDEIAELLGVSKASVSTDARRLAEMALVERTGRPGERRDYYAIPSDFHEAILSRSLGTLREMQGILNEGSAIPALRERDDVRERLAVASGVIERLLTTYSDLLEGFRGSLRAGTPT